MSSASNRPLIERRRLAVGLGIMALLGSGGIAMARGGRTTAADCAAGSDDPDCPDTPASQGKSQGKPSQPGGAGAAGSAGKGGF